MNDNNKEEFMDFLEGKRVCIGKISETMYGYDYVPREPEEIWQWHLEKMEEAYAKGYLDAESDDLKLQREMALTLKKAFGKKKRTPA